MNTKELESKISLILSNCPHEIPDNLKKWISMRLIGLFIVGYNEGKELGFKKGTAESRTATLKQCSEMVDVFGPQIKEKIDELIRANKGTEKN